MTRSRNLRRMRRRWVKRLGKRTLRRTTAFMGGQSRVGDAPVFDAARFPFLKPFEDQWPAVLTELEDVLRDRDRLPAFHEISPDQKKISQGENWKIFIFCGFGSRSEMNCARCPQTTRLLDGVPGLQSAWFSILAPGVHIPAHRGVTKGVLRAHLGLIVPEQRERCFIVVEDHVLHWEQGRCIVFDDTYRHEVRNDTNEERVVLLLDFDRPMRPMGRAVHKFFVSAIKQTAFFKDPKRNLDAWEEAVRRADAMFDESSAASNKQHRPGL